MDALNLAEAENLVKLAGAGQGIPYSALVTQIAQRAPGVPSSPGLVPRTSAFALKA
jgi:hypothetical protein